MRPLRLELEGFTSYRERTEVSFRDADLFVLTGATGSGKSSLIDAMIFALYGSVPRYDNLKLIAPVISQGKVRARVRFDFEARGNTYSAVRVVQRTAAGATTKEARLEERAGGGAARTLAITESDLSKCVRDDVIGLGLDHFTKCVVLPQGEFAAFLRAKPGERKQLLERLLGLGLYESLRRAANLRWKLEEGKADQLQWRLESELADATPEAVRGAERRLEVLNHLGERIDEASRDLRELDASIQAAVDRRTKAAEQLRLLEAVRAPEGVMELAARQRQADERSRSAGRAWDVAAARLREARTERAALPERAAVEKVVAQRRELARRASELEAARRERKAAEEVLAEAKTEEEALGEQRATLGASLERLPAKAELEHVREQRRELRTLDVEVKRARGDLAAAEEAYAAATTGVAAANGALEAARRALEALRLAHTAADMAHHLEEGSPCPVCLRTVLRMPDRDPPADLDAARARKAAAEADLARATEERDRRAATRAARAATLSHGAGNAESLRERLEGKPAPEEIDALLTRIREGEEDTRRLDRLVREAAERRARRDRRLSVARATLDERERATTQLRSELAEAPTVEEATTQLAAIQAADEVLRRARSEEEATRRARDEAKNVLEGWAGRTGAAWSRFHEARDRVAPMRPPGPVEGDLSESWRLLEGWGAEARRETEREAARLDARVEHLSADRSRRDSALRERCRAEGLEVGDDDDPVSACAAARGAAGNELGVLRAAAAQRARVRKERRAARERSRIARDLGTHLNAKHFGAWLQNQVLAWLVRGATARLHQLSSGQYSLDLSDRNEFLVIDHRNADEPRLAKTLSGGETFLASLALALSLAEQVANLAAHGGRRLEAFFLDEGFGTLDSETLDVVAATIEQLGTERMVGIVTHVSELADRIPVQYRVRKVGNSSSVERVEA